MAKTVKPRTNLMLDVCLFSLALLHLTAAVTVNIIVHDPGPAYESWHRLLGFTGVALFLVVTTHLRFHLPWIKAQFQRFFNPGSRNRANGRREG